MFGKSDGGIKFMKTDIQIAKEAVMLPISAIAEKLGVKENEYEPYGWYKAKISDAFLERKASETNGKLILVRDVT